MAKYIEGGPWEDLTVSPDKIVVFDTETTGTNRDKDEMLQISIIDGAAYPAIYLSFQLVLNYRVYNFVLHL